MEERGAEAAPFCEESQFCGTSRRTPAWVLESCCQHGIEGVCVNAMCHTAGCESTCDLSSGQCGFSVRVGPLDCWKEEVVASNILFVFYGVISYFQN